MIVNATRNASLVGDSGSSKQVVNHDHDKFAKVKPSRKSDASEPSFATSVKFNFLLEHVQFGLGKQQRTQDELMRVYGFRVYLIQ